LTRRATTSRRVSLTFIRTPTRDWVPREPTRVRGELVVDGGKITGKLPGKVLTSSDRRQNTRINHEETKETKKIEDRGSKVENRPTRDDATLHPSPSTLDYLGVLRFFVVLSNS
ncbi:MAG TPA: hypothetical protein VKS99_15425, partial [Blastocatellia bacterium]|nr:hypothetical protein [Blastocatellia bacterium]